ncbi:putative metalloprotease [Frankliniella fusca]|uniref:Metalloprotease n=1 Tax=Frankliniella fusca TaxID=407009 RepID=A0AAE1HBI3_9NEOP|nr:putative metalloprotease [Frankliniella fusca]
MRVGYPTKILIVHEKQLLYSRVAREHSPILAKRKEKNWRILADTRQYSPSFKSLKEKYNGKFCSGIKNPDTINSLEELKHFSVWKMYRFQSPFFQTFFMWFLNPKGLLDPEWWYGSLKHEHHQVPQLVKDTMSLPKFAKSSKFEL